MIVATPTIALHLCVPHPPLFAPGQTVAMAVTVLDDLTRGDDLRTALADGHAAVRAELGGRSLVPGPLPSVAIHRTRQALPELYAVFGHLAAHDDRADVEAALAQLAQATDALSATQGRYAGAVLVALAGAHHLSAVPTARLAGALS